MVQYNFAYPSNLSNSNSHHNHNTNRNSNLIILAFSNPFKMPKGWKLKCVQAVSATYCAVHHPTLHIHYTEAHLPLCKHNETH